MTNNQPRLVTLFGNVCEVTDKPVTINGKPSSTVVVLRSTRTGDEYHVLRKVVEQLPDTIKRDSFDWHPDH
jgi:hypothetical protein